MRPHTLRSVLFVPGDRPKMLDKARSVEADAVILDLEDSVAVQSKDTARAMVSDALRAGGLQPFVVVRVNGFGSGLTERDVTAVVCPQVQALCLPKSESVEKVILLSRLLESTEQRQGMTTGSISIFLMLETALGILKACDLADATDRACALCLGGEDLCWDLGAVRTKLGTELEHARGQLVLAARAAGIQPIDTVWTDLDDQAGLEHEARRARQMGFAGKLLIHPRQIESVNRAFSPEAKEIDYARRVVEAYEAGAAHGKGVVKVDGRMIDAPVVARARKLLACVEGKG